MFGFEKRLTVLALVCVVAVPMACYAQQNASPQGRPAFTPPPPDPLEVVRLDPALDALIPQDAKIEKVASGFGWSEAPMWRHNRMWFVDGRGDKVLAITSDSKLTDLITTDSGFTKDTWPNGMATDKDGSVLMCEQLARRMVRITGPDNALKVEPVFDSYEGKRLNSPNDIIFARDGSFYFTDPPYGLKGMDKDPAKELAFNGVFHVVKGKLTPIIKDLTIPNGLTITPDGKTLYVANSGPHMMIMKYPLQADGTAGPGTMFVEFTRQQGRGIPDGIKLDSKGNLWTTGPGGIRIITPEGKVLGQLKFPEVAANLGWGDDGKTLYITASSSIYKIRTNVMGNLPIYKK